MKSNGKSNGPRALLLSLPLLWPAAAAGAASATSTASERSQPGPDNELRMAQRALRRCDLLAAHKYLAPPSHSERHLAAWHAWLDGLAPGVVEELEAFVARAQAPNGEDELVNGILAELPRLAAAWRTGVERAAARIEAAAPWLVTDPVTRERFLAATAALRERLLAMEIDDPRRGAEALRILARAARSLQFRSLAEVRALGLEATLRKGSALLVFVKQALAVYGVGLDRPIDSLVFRLLAADDARALVEASFKGRGEHPAPFHIEMASLDGRWVPTWGSEAAVSALPALVREALAFPAPDELELPRSTSAVRFAWSDDPVRPVVHVLASGEIRAGGIAAAPGAELPELRTWLAGRASAMRDGSPLLLHVDARAPFGRVMHVVAPLGSADARAPELRLAAVRADGGAGALAMSLASDAEPDATVLRLAAGEDGVLECTLGESSIRGREALAVFLAAELGRAGGAVVLEVGPAVACGDVVLALDACAEAGVAVALRPPPG